MLNSSDSLSIHCRVHVNLNTKYSEVGFPNLWLHILPRHVLFRLCLTSQCDCLWRAISVTSIIHLFSKCEFSVVRCEHNFSVSTCGSTWILTCLSVSAYWGIWPCVCVECVCLEYMGGCWISLLDVCVRVIYANRPDNLVIQPCAAKGVCVRHWAT